MKALICDHCGGDLIIEKDGYRICGYCKSRFIIPKEERKVQSAAIDLNDDVARLLEKCKKEPFRARRYAALILEIDPTNAEARRIVNRGF